MTVNDATRKLVRERAKFLCEYCHSLEEASASLFSIDHIIPQSLSGSDESNNLALACQRCNGHRYNLLRRPSWCYQSLVPRSGIKN